MRAKPLGPYRLDREREQREAGRKRRELWYQSRGQQMAGGDGIGEKGTGESRDIRRERGQGVGLELHWGSGELRLVLYTDWDGGGSSPSSAQARPWPSPTRPSKARPVQEHTP